MPFTRSSACAQETLDHCQDSKAVEFIQLGGTLAGEGIETDAEQDFYIENNDTKASCVSPVSKAVSGDRFGLDAACIAN